MHQLQLQIMTFNSKMKILENNNYNQSITNNIIEDFIQVAINNKVLN
jgi:hypothetical protein